MCIPQESSFLHPEDLTDIHTVARPRASSEKGVVFFRPYYVVVAIVIGLEYVVKHGESDLHATEQVVLMHDMSSATVDVHRYGLEVVTEIENLELRTMLVPSIHIVGCTLTRLCKVFDHSADVFFMSSNLLDTECEEIRCRRHLIPV